MTSYLEALQIIRQKACENSRRRHERVAIAEAVGRVSVDDVLSPTKLPAFDTSAMDGFAVHSSETLHATTENPITLRVVGSRAAGDTLQSTLPAQRNSSRDEFRDGGSKPATDAAPEEMQTKQTSRDEFRDGGSKPATDGAAWEIMTGAAFPPGFDACVRQEDVTPIFSMTGDHVESIRITKPVHAHQNRRLAGEDFAPGKIVIQKGHLIRDVDLLCLTALGITEIDVTTKLKVAVIATGKELVDHHAEPTGSQIRNSTTPYLYAALKNRGVETHHLGTVGDDADEFLALIERAAKNFDVILTTGAISVGKYDFVARALEGVGLKIYFQKVAIRPGKPLLFGRLPNGTFVMGLPGNPVATATGQRFFVEPLLNAIANQADEKPLKARLKTSTRKAAHATCFLKAILTQGEKTLEVEAHLNQKASITNSLLTSNAWIVLDAKMPEELSPGTLVDVYPYTSLFNSINSV